MRGPLGSNIHIPSNTVLLVRSIPFTTDIELTAIIQTHVVDPKRVLAGHVGARFPDRRRRQIRLRLHPLPT